MSKLTNLEKWARQRDSLLAVAESESNHILDRIDAFLALSEFYNRDVYQRAGAIRQARDLIGKERKAT